MPLFTVTDLDDPRLDDYRNVPDPELVRRRGIFVAEGRLVVARLLATRRFNVRSVMVTDTALGSLGTLSEWPALPVFVIPQALMNGIVGFNIHRGCLAIGERPPDAGWRTLAAHARRLLVLERIGDADNVGALFRSAAAFAVDAVLIGPACADPLYRKAIRTSMGAALSLPFARAEPWPGVLPLLSGTGFATIGLTPAADAPVVREAARSCAGRPVALVVGHEGSGLTRDALDQCSHHARIRMAAGVDSLNVATAAAIAMNEFNEG